MKRIFEFIYPDYGGYTFFSVVVWEGSLELADPEKHIGWSAVMRVLEARYVIRGQIIHHEVDAANLDADGWGEILEKARKLKLEWSKEFKGER